MTPYLSVIIPAYHEQQRIGATLGDCYAYLSKQAFAWELLVVVDGSRDGTLDVVERFAAGKPGIRALARHANRGKGYSVREGLLAARGDIRLFMDADNSTNLAHFDQMAPLFTAGCDVVIGSRDPKDAAGARRLVPQKALKTWAGKAGNLLVQMLLLPGIWDTQCGFKAFTRRAAETIAPLARMDRWSFDIEALALARRFDFQLGFVPARWTDDPRSHVSVRSYLDVLWETVTIRWHLLRGDYDRHFSLLWHETSSAGFQNGGQGYPAPIARRPSYRSVE